MCMCACACCVHVCVCVFLCLYLCMCLAVRADATDAVQRQVSSTFLTAYNVTWPKQVNSTIKYGAVLRLDLVAYPGTQTPL